MTCALCALRPRLDRTGQDGWGYLVAAFRPDRLFVVGDTGGTRAFRGAEVVQSLADLPHNLIPVLLSPQRSSGRWPGLDPLTSLRHPGRAVYVTGPDDGVITEEDIGGRRLTNRVYIPLPTDEELYSHVAMAIALYDRIAKDG